MPSLCTKPQENGATPPDTTLQAALAIVEKKVRNLEKRKGKLDAYRDTLERGKTLNEDQQAAVAKYDEVIGTLEFARELSGQFNKLAIDEAKDKKKMMRKEQQEKARVELVKVTYVLSVREVLSALLEEGVLEDLEAGSNGAPKLSAEQLTQLQQFQELATPNREDLAKGSFEKQVAASADHLVNLAEKKARAVVGTTYQELAELINLVRECGYIEAKWANDSSANTENGADDATQDTAEEDEEEELVVEEDTELIEDDDEVTEVEILDNQTNGHYVSAEEEAKANMLGQTMAAAPEPVAEPVPVFPSPPQVAEVPKPVPAPIPAPEPSFNFLQESQIDLESPHMDPAVVMVHPPKRAAVPVHQGVPPGIPSQTFTNQLFQQSLAGLTPAQQQALLAQQQAIIAQQQQQQAAAAQQQAAAAQQQAAANNSQQDYQAIQQQLQQRQAAEKRSSEKFASSYNSAFDTPQKGAPGVASGPPGQPQPAPFIQNNGPPAQQDQRSAPVEQQQQQQQQPAFSGQSAPMEQRAAAPVDPRAPRVPEGTPQHQEQSQSPQARPAGYAAAAGGITKQPDTEIGTWKPEGVQDWNEEEEDGRWGGERGRGRGRGGGRGFGRGNRGYSRGRGDRGGDRGHRGGDRGRGERKYDDRRDDRGGKYEDRGDRGDRPRGGYRGRGENGGRGGGGYRGRGGAEGGRGGPRGGGQNGYRD
eukprot:GFUD01014934.1.p1 GENE.GFUD01014934.1~~GFUD01014934.1.p1  ORF type:complete len:703 (-),score=275.86 GFUD01014934.1:953-3061(-)